jgi:ribonucleotide monophosphatase NagD (HAD superfamily)
MFAKYYLINVEVLRSRTDSPLAAQQFLRGLQAAGLPFLLVADASGRTRGQLCGKLQDQGFRGISEQQIYTSAMAAVDYACRVAPAKKNARFLGGAGLGAALETGGFMLQGGTPDWLFLGLDRNAAYSDYTNALRILDQGAQLITADNARCCQAGRAAVSATARWRICWNAPPGNRRSGFHSRIRKLCRMRCVMPALCRRMRF